MWFALDVHTSERSTLPPSPFVKLIDVTGSWLETSPHQKAQNPFFLILCIGLVFVCLKIISPNSFRVGQPSPLNCDVLFVYKLVLLLLQEAY